MTNLLFMVIGLLCFALFYSTSLTVYYRDLYKVAKRLLQSERRKVEDLKDHKSFDRDKEDKDKEE